jgi:hypothetical protein
MNRYARMSYTGTVRMRGTYRANVTVIRPTLDHLRTVVVQRVLGEIAHMVGIRIAARIPASWGSKLSASLSGLRGVWLAPARVDLPGNRVQLATVEDLNEASGGRLQRKGSGTHRYGESVGGTWNYGAWFNLEFGREWPNVEGDTWLYQENPGPAASPAASKPPGAGPADIDMRKWLVTGKRPKGGSNSGIPDTFMQRPARVRVGTPFAIPRSRLEANMAVHLREIQAGKDEGKRYPRRLRGRFGDAPIRLGFVEGINDAREALPRLMQQALAEIGKARAGAGGG